MWRICKSAVTSAEHLLSWETPAVEHPYSLGNQATSPRICTDTTTQLQNTTGRKIVKIKETIWRIAKKSIFAESNIQNYTHSTHIKYILITIYILPYNLYTIINEKKAISYQYHSGYRLSCDCVSTRLYYDQLHR